MNTQHNALLQHNGVSTLPGKTKHNTKTTLHFLQCILSNKLFLTFTESRWVLVFTLMWLRYVRVYAAANRLSSVWNVRAPILSRL